MKKYELQILRYHHDVITGEFVNVGIVMFNKEEKFLKGAVTHKYARLSKFFHAERTANFVSQIIRSFEVSVRKISDELSFKLNIHQFENIETITTQILPKDDSSLQCSEIITGLSLDFEKTFKELFDRYIVKYEHIQHRESRTDEEAWNQVYKKYFDEYGLSKKLSKHQLKTQNDKFEFDLAFQNGSLHLYNPVSFDLVDHDSIRDKAYKWKGKISEIETANQDIQIHMLLLYPDKSDNKDKEFINKVLLSSSRKDNIKLHNENNLQSHLKEMKKYLSGS